MRKYFHLKAKYNHVFRKGRYHTDMDEVLNGGHGHLPRFAEKEPNKYWYAADIYERSNGRLCKAVEYSLPKEVIRFGSIVANHMGRESKSTMKDCIWCGI